VTALALSRDKPVIRRSLAESLLTCSVFEREDAEYLAFGQAFHSFAAAYQLHCRAIGEETSLVDVGRLANEAWHRTPGLMHGRWPEFMKLCDDFAQTHRAGLDSLLHVEHTEVLDVGWAILTCTIDRIDRADLGDPDDEPRRELDTDWKTEQGEMDHAFQASWYIQMRFVNHPNLEEVVFQVDSVRDRYRADPLVVRRGQLDLWWKGMLVALRERWEAPPSSRVPTGGPACEGCAHRFDCPKALTVAREIPETEEQADELFEEALRLEQAFAARKSALEVFYRRRAERVVAGHEVGFLRPRLPHLKVTAKPLGLRAWLNKRHLDGDSVLKVDNEQLRQSAIREQLVDAGLAVEEFSKPAFKWRHYVPARQARDHAREIERQ
jgi:hypothetical protein